MYKNYKIDLSNVIFIGLRDSDAVFTNYNKIITCCGLGKNNDVALNKRANIRYNYNNINNDKLITNFFENEILDIIKINRQFRFAYYNKATTISNKVRKYCVFQPKKRIIDLLNNKFRARQAVQKISPCLIYQYLQGNQINYEICQKKFNNYNKNIKFVLQEKKSIGGEKTFLLKKDNSVLNNLNKKEKYAISIYQENNIPVNVHFLIAKDNYLILPPSVQIINPKCNMLEYGGCDFPAYKTMVTQKMQTKVKEYVKNICLWLQKIGYRGVGGIDFIIANDEAYFMEINPRYQSSTLALNYALHENNLPTINELDAICFKYDSLPKLPLIEIPYSKVNTIQDIDTPLYNLPKIDIVDGYSEDEQIESHAYKYSILYFGSILENSN